METIYLDLSTILFVGMIVVGFGTLQGFIFGVFMNGIQMYCNWRDGADVDWGSEIGFTVAAPLIWFFVFLEIVFIYFK
jgi:hypothetical protein